MQVDNSKTSQLSSFLNNYNEKFGEYLNKISGSFFDRIRVDKDILLERTSGTLQRKFQQIDSMINDTDASKDNYYKTKVIGKILIDITPDMINSPDSDVKKSGVNLINSFFEVARKTEDNELMETSFAIRKIAESQASTS